MKLGAPNTTARAVAARYGFRSVERVQVRQRMAPGGELVAFATGIAHRCPRTVRVPLRVAAELVAAGVPFTSYPPAQPSPSGER